MKPKSSNTKLPAKSPAERVVKDIRRQTRRHFSAEDKIRIVLEGLGIGSPGFVFSTNQSDRHAKGIQTLIAPQGRFGLIDDPETLDVLGFKRKAASIHWELMFTRAIFGTPDIGEQGKLLAPPDRHSGNDHSRLGQHCDIRNA